jgi:hypothetical protein
MELNEVLKFIKNCSKEDLDLIQDIYNVRRLEVKSEWKSQFLVGDDVRIIHKKVSPESIFEVIKINRKNIKVKNKNNLFQTYSVSPNLLEKIK